MIESTPDAESRLIASLLFTVQTETDKPRSWKAYTARLDASPK